MFAFYFMLLWGFFPFLFLLIASNRHLKRCEKVGRDAAAYEKGYRLSRRFVRVCEKHTRTKLQVFGKENIPPREDGGYMIIPNHQGKYDALAVIRAFENEYVSVLMEMKKSQMPAARQVMAMTDGVSIDLTSPKQQLRAIREVGVRMRDGAKFVVFPEGGYTDNHNSVMEFHNGCFYAANIAKCPIVPVCLVDTYLSMNRNNIFRKVRPQLHILPAIPYEDWCHMDRPQLAEHVRGLIEEHMKEVLKARGEEYVCLYTPPQSTPHVQANIQHIETVC